jgi:hypothetical protein
LLAAAGVGKFRVFSLPFPSEQTSPVCRYYLLPDTCLPAAVSPVLGSRPLELSNKEQSTAMPAHSLRIDDLNDLRRYVYQTLCEENDFEIGAFEITERFLIRSGEPCGIYFCLHGPRSVKFTAIWETDRNTILFYGSSGERQRRTQLAQAPSLEPVTA